MYGILVLWWRIGIGVCYEGIGVCSVPYCCGWVQNSVMDDKHQTN